MAKNHVEEKKKTKQNNTTEKKKKTRSEIRNIEKTKQEKTIKTKLLGVNPLFLLFCHSSANSVSISVY